MLKEVWKPTKSKTDGKCLKQLDSIVVDNEVALKANGHKTFKFARTLKS